MSASPRWDYVQPCLPVLLRSADGEALREKVRGTVSTALGARSTADYPMLATPLVTEHWPMFRDQVLEPLRAAALTKSLDFATYSRTDAAEA